MGRRGNVPRPGFRFAAITQDWRSTRTRVRARLATKPLHRSETMITADQISDLAQRNDAYRAAIHILASEAFANDGRVWRHVTSFGIDFDAILEEGTWSSGEYHLLAIAGSLCNGHGRPNLDAAFAALSHEWADLALEAMRIRAGGRQAP